MQGIIRREATRIEVALKEADELHAEARYDDAITMLEPIAKLKHARLADLVQQATDRLGQLSAERDCASGRGREGACGRPSGA